jgi:hypothetical protein
VTSPALAISVTGRGRHYKHPVNEALYPSVTNIIETLAKPWLAGWKAKMVAGFAWDERELVASMADREAAIDYLKGGPTRERNRAAAVGDLIHEYAEAVARELPTPDIPEELKPHVAPFLSFLAEYHPRFKILEGTVFYGEPTDPLRYAGSFDCLLEIPGEDSSAVVLGDYKSGGDRVYDEVALQLAALSHADEVWDEATGDLAPMPHVDGCIAIHLRPGQLKVHLVDAGDRAFAAFLGLRQAWPWDKDHTGAVGPTMNRVRLLKELGRPDTLLDQLEKSVEETSARAAVDGGDSGSTQAAIPLAEQDGPDVLSKAAPAEDSPAAEEDGSRRSASPKTLVSGSLPETEGEVPASLDWAGASPAGGTE